MLIGLQMLETPEDRSRFELLYERYNRLMFYVAYQVLRDQHDVEDAVQQAYVVILENLYRLPPVDSPKTKAFVTIITERKAIDILRRRAKIVDVDFEEAAAGLYIPQQESNGLTEALAKLPARYREALMLRYYVGYNTQELAQVLGMRPDSVKRLVSRAKKLLEEKLNERDDRDEKADVFRG